MAVDKLQLILFSTPLKGILRREVECQELRQDHSARHIGRKRWKGIAKEIRRIEHDKQSL